VKRFFSFVSLVVLVAVVAAGCNFSVSTANIASATLSKDVKGDQFEPVDPTTTFSTDQPVIHLVAKVANTPEGTKVKSVWTAVDVGDVAPANTKIAETEIVLNSDGNAHFTLSIPDTGVWPVGKYKVEVYLNDKLDRTLEYSVAK
jgi:hypothetical protein